jgi:hypothetical protein
MPDAFDPYYKWLAIPPKDQPPNHYRLLGVELLESDADVIANAADSRMAQLKLYQTGDHVNDAQRLLNEVAAARTCLLNSERKDEYDDLMRADVQIGQVTSIETVTDLEQVSDAVEVVESVRRAKPAARTSAERDQEESPTETAEDGFPGIDVGGEEPKSSQHRQPANRTKSGSPQSANKKGQAPSPTEKRPNRNAFKIKVIGHIVAPLLGLGLGVLILIWIRPDYFGGDDTKKSTASQNDGRAKSRKEKKPDRTKPKTNRNTKPPIRHTQQNNDPKNPVDEPGTTDGDAIPDPGTFVNPPNGTDGGGVVDPVDPLVQPVEPKELTPEEILAKAEEDLATAIEAVNITEAVMLAGQIAELDGGDVLEKRVAVFEQLLGKAESPAQFKAVVETGLSLLDEALEAGEKAAAVKLANATLAVARASKDSALTRQATLGVLKVQSAGS